MAFKAISLVKLIQNNNYKFFYYESKYFEELFNLRMKFEKEHNPEKRPKTKSENKKLEKTERKYLKKNSKNKYYRYFLCSKGNKLIGHIWFGQQDSDRKKGFIDEVYVKPKHRGKGVATILINEAIEWINAKNCSLVELDVKVQNKGAISLYKKIGFTEQKPEWINFLMNLPRSREALPREKH